MNLLSDYWGETEPDLTEALTLAKQSQYPCLWAEHLLAKAEGKPPLAKHTYSEGHPWAGPNSLTQPCLGLFKPWWHPHSIELRNLLGKLCCWCIQHKQNHIFCCVLGWREWGVCKRAKDAWQPLEKSCLNLLKDSMAKQTPSVSQAQLETQLIQLETQHVYAPWYRGRALDVCQS